MDKKLALQTVEESIRVQVGDLVRTGPNAWPTYVVVALDGDKAWVRNADNGADGLTQADRCRRVH